MKWQVYSGYVTAFHNSSFRLIKKDWGVDAKCPDHGLKRTQMPHTWGILTGCTKPHFSIGEPVLHPQAITSSFPKGLESPLLPQPAPTICRNSWWDTFQQGSSAKSVNPIRAGGCERSHHQLGWAISGTILTNGPLCHSTPAFLFQPSSLSFSQTETPRISWSRIWYRADKLKGTGKNWHEQIDSGAIHNTEHVIKGGACVDGYPA